MFEQVAWSSHNANRVEHWRPGGRLVAVDHDAPTSVPKAMSPATVRRLAEDAGVRLVSRDDRWAPTEVIQVFEPIRR